MFLKEGETSMLRGMILVLLITLCIGCLSCGGGGVSTPTPVTSCAGAACLNFSVVQEDYCQQFDPKKPNAAYFATAKLSSFSLPIYLYYQVIETDPQGVDQPPSPEQQRLVVQGGLATPSCQAAQINGVIYTQRLFVLCETDRQMPNGANHTSCTPAEQLQLTVQINYGNSARIPMHLNSKDRVYAPRALNPTDVVDCAVACTTTSDVPCLNFSSTAVSAKLLNLVNNWQPGKPLTKNDAMAAMGVSNDKCSRSDSLLESTGRLRNSAPNSCAISLGTIGEEQGDEASVTIPTVVSGYAQAGSSDRRIAFDSGKELQLVLPGDLGVYGGSIWSMSAPAGASAIDIRTPAACVRIHEH